MSSEISRTPGPYTEWVDAADPLVGSATLGDGLRLARERQGRSLAAMSDQTKVHVKYLTALEQNDHSALPSRVFALGYLRAYAQALGIDEQAAADRFKQESFDASVPLQPPSGSAFQEISKQSPRILAALGAVVLAVICWNVFQRVSMVHAAQPSDLAETPSEWATQADALPGNSITLSAARPAPPDQTTPILYVTPGLEAQLSDVTALADAVDPAQSAGRSFNPRGPIHGAPATASAVILQANRPANLVVKVGRDRILFARQMAAGEAWRAPLEGALQIEVSNPAAFDVFLNGAQSQGLAAEATALATLNVRAQSDARQTAARQTAQREAEQRAVQQRNAAAQATPAASPPVQPPAPVAPPTQ